MELLIRRSRSDESCEVTQVVVAQATRKDQNALFSRHVI